jgi:predicted Zn-dependent protease
MRKLNPSKSKLLREMGRVAQSQMEGMNTGQMKANLSKAEEMQADRDAVLLAWRAGYEAWGLVAVLQRFEVLTRSRRTGGTNTLEVHPAPLERFKSLDLALRARSESQTLGEQAGARFEQATRQLRGTTL